MNLAVRAAGLLAAFIAVVALPLPIGAQSGARPEAGTSGAAGRGGSAAIPRTPWGDPDLQGTYNNSNESGIPMERPKEFEGRSQKDITPAELQRAMEVRRKRALQTAETIGGTAENDTGAGPPHWYENYNANNSRAWMVSDPPDGKIPQVSEESRARAAAVRAARRGGDGYYRGPFDGPQDFTLYVRCITRGLPGSMMPAIYGNSYDITQSPTAVAIRYEMVHETRVIPIDGRPHAPSSIKSYMGDARGRWEGDTLVVETRNFLAAAAYGNASEDLRTIERFTPVRGGIEWSITFDDSRTWAKPWTFGMFLARDDNQPVVEYACHEGNEGMRGMLSAARAEERETAAAGGK